MCVTEATVQPRARLDHRYDLSIRDVAPHEAAVLLPSVHTGGAWLWRCEVWKPLDARPYANAPYHYPTMEDVVLEEMADQPLFPRNWRIETRNDRRFLVRKQGLVLGKDMPYVFFGENDALLVETAVRNLNRRKWEVNDSLQLAWDIERKEWYVFDLSAAQRMDGIGAFAADDTDRIVRLFLETGCEWLATLRRGAKRAHSKMVIKLALSDEVDCSELHHIYAATYEPASPEMALPCRFQVEPVEEGSETSKHLYSWVFCAEPLSELMQRKYLLKWAWSPVHGV